MSSQKQGQKADEHEAGPPGQGIKAEILANLASDTKEVAFDIHVSVVPLGNSPNPNVKTWVIQSRLYEGTKPLSHPFVVTVFRGEGEPLHELFLGRALDEARQLCESQSINGKPINLKFRGVTASPAARAYVTGIVPLCGTEGCTDCVCVKWGEKFRCDNMTSPPSTADTEVTSKRRKPCP